MRERKELNKELKILGVVESNKNIVSKLLGFSISIRDTKIKSGDISIVPYDFSIIPFEKGDVVEITIKKRR